jgi:putative acetyltransferase
MSEAAGGRQGPPGDLVIRPVRLADAEAINEIRRQPRVLELTLALPSERIEENRRFIEALGPNDHLLVAEVDGRVVGLAGLHVMTRKQRHSATLGMAVHDQLQGRGIGRRLLAALLDLADNYLGLIRVELEVLADNAPAIRLYESAGFEHEGRKRSAVLRQGQYVDVLVMARLR